MALALAIPILAPAAAFTTIYDAGLGSLPQAQGFTAHLDAPIVPSVGGGFLDVDAFTQGLDNRNAWYSDVNGTFLFSSFVMEANVKILNSTQRSVPGGGNFPRAGFSLSAATTIIGTFSC